SRRRSAKTTCCFKARWAALRPATFSCTSVSVPTTRASTRHSSFPARRCASSSTDLLSDIARNRVPVAVAEPELAALRRARRILVLGAPGSGKTLLSTFLSRHLGLELIRLDEFFWRPGPVRMPTDEWRILAAQLASRPAWVMDGTYEASLDL